MSRSKESRDWFSKKYHVFTKLEEIIETYPIFKKYLSDKKEELFRTFSDMESIVFNNMQYLNIYQIYSFLLVYIQKNAIPIDPYEFPYSHVSRVAKLAYYTGEIREIMNFEFDRKTYLMNVYYRICSELEIELTEISIPTKWKGSVLSHVLRYLHLAGKISTTQAMVYLKERTKLNFVPLAALNKVRDMYRRKRR